MQDQPGKRLAGLLTLLLPVEETHERPSPKCPPVPSAGVIPVQSHPGRLAVLVGQKQAGSAQDLRDLLLQGAPEELEEEVSLSGAGGVAVEAEDHRLHELGRLVGWHLHEQPGQVHRLSLEGGKGCLGTNGFPGLGATSTCPGQGPLPAADPPRRSGRAENQIPRAKAHPWGCIHPSLVVP